MRDLLLWRLLQQDEPDPGRLVPLLDEAARLPVQERFAFFGLLDGVVQHVDPAVRAAGLRVLGGAVGRPGWERLVRGLGDPDAAVRRAAVEALRASAAFDPPRWAHALFHPQGDVRQAALEGDDVPGAEWLALYLAPDPLCGGTALAKATAVRHRVPGIALSALLDFAEHGTVPRDVVRRLAAGIPFNESSGGPGRTVREIAAILAAAGRREAAPPVAPELIVEALRGETSHDPLDALFDLFWDADAGEEADAFFTAVRDALLESRLSGGSDRHRVVASLLVTAARRGTWNAGAAGLCAAYHPEFLRMEWVPRAVRRQAVEALYDLGDRCPKHPPPFVQGLAQTEVGRRPSGNLDLWVVGGLMHLLTGSRFRKALHWFGEDRIVSAALEDLEESVPFFAVNDTGPAHRTRLISKVVERRRPKRAFFHALLAHRISAGCFEFLEALDADQASAVLGQMLVLAGRPGKPLTENRARTAARILGAKTAGKSVGRFVGQWLDQPDPKNVPIGVEVLHYLARHTCQETLVRDLAALNPFRVRRLLEVMAWRPGVPYAFEVRLAQELASHADEEVRSWAAVRAPASIRSKLRGRPEKGTGALPPGTARDGRREPVPFSGQPLSEAEAREIAESPDWSLPLSLAPCLDSPVRGLCAALERRPDPAEPSRAACVALLACHDPPDGVDREFARFGSPEPAFLSQLELEMVTSWQGRADLGLFGHAWLFRWEKHAVAFAEAAGPDRLADVLAWAQSLRTPVLRDHVWQAVERIVGLWRFRDRERLLNAWSEPLATVLVEGLTGAADVCAARILRHVWHTKGGPEKLEAIHAAVLARVPDLSDEVRQLLHPWIDLRGLGGPVVRRPLEKAVGPELLATIAGSSDLDRLEAWCCDENATIADEATLRLLELGEPGAARLLAVLTRVPLPPAATVVADSLSLWPEGPALDQARWLVDDGRRPMPLRFLLAVGLLERGERERLDDVAALACRETDESWFRPEDWQRLLDAGVPPGKLSLRLACSPHPHAYRSAVSHLLSLPELDGAAVKALHEFLDTGTGRMRDLRIKAAWRLHARGDFHALPLLWQEAVSARDCRNDPPHRNPLHGVPAHLVEPLVAAAVTAGPRHVDEQVLFELVRDEEVDVSARHDAARLLLMEVAGNSVRESVVAWLKQTGPPAGKLRRVAEEFAWGVQCGRELTGRLFTIEMLAGDDLGYTRLEEDRIFVNALPVLRGEQNGRDVVQALVLHEIGHHMYHRGEEPQRLWRKAHDEGIGRLLNLVADEHLERNLRALDRGFGDRLKRLAAYAFQHADRQIEVAGLLQCLGGRAFEVLTASRLRAARRKGCVRIDNGQVLLEMERAGLSFARFVRALRMGLGNRHDDPKVAEALRLFRGKFRRRDMAGLVEIARELRRIFGWETVLIEHLGQDAACSGDGDELLAHGEGIGNEDLQEEIRRITNPQKPPSDDGHARPKDGTGRWINVSPDEQFDRIHTVVPMRFDPAAHAPYAKQVAARARQLQRYLKDLGVALLPQKRRVRGRSLDRGQLPALVLRGDPRILKARERVVQNDLFLSAVIDCSGSMQIGENIEKAKLFGALLAEAVRGTRGIDLRLFGFTDRVIFDAGTAERPAVHALEAGGGNNDAAALWHAAQQALASRRRTKLLVMVSDGLPTECSVEALRSLVTRLTRRMKMCCAQVAVRPLEEVCFPHYVVLDDADPSASVRRFGALIARLVRQALK